MGRAPEVDCAAAACALALARIERGVCCGIVLSFPTLDSARAVLSQAYRPWKIEHF